MKTALEIAAFLDFDPESLRNNSTQPKPLAALKTTLKTTRGSGPWVNVYFIHVSNYRDFNLDSNLPA